MDGKMQTFTGKVFDFENVKGSTVCIEDIAHALSLTCRFNGHVPKFYSVAEHSCLAHDLIVNEEDRKYNLYLLLHDASEAYLNDIVSPIKHSLPDYLAIETCIQEYIFTELIGGNPYFSVSLEKFIKIHDNLVLQAERKKFFPINPFPWKFKDIYKENYILKISNEIKCWSPEQAEKEFLCRYEKDISCLLCEEKRLVS